MPREKTESHEKILAAAREEFLAYGFEKASMRRIGERCGMTAAGLYRHCRDKEDLFTMLVQPAAEKIDVWMDAHIQRSITAMEEGRIDLWDDSEIDMMRDLIYPHMEEYRLLLTKAQGTAYENYLHTLTEKQLKLMIMFMPMLKEKGYWPQHIDAKELYILLSVYTSAMFEPVIHGYSKEEALRCLDTLEVFFLPGWKQLLGV